MNYAPRILQGPTLAVCERSGSAIGQHARTDKEIVPLSHDLPYDED